MANIYPVAQGAAQREVPASGNPAPGKEARGDRHVGSPGTAGSSPNLGWGILMLHAADTPILAEWTYYRPWTDSPSPYQRSCSALVA